MQQISYLMIEGKKILVLIRPKKYTRVLKLRFTGSDGKYFEGESIFLSLPENKKTLDKLLAGKVIEV